MFWRGSNYIGRVKNVPQKIDTDDAVPIKQAMGILAVGLEDILELRKRLEKSEKDFSGKAAERMLRIGAENVRTLLRKRPQEKTERTKVTV